jgi:hypothetical protein
MELRNEYSLSYIIMRRRSLSDISHSRNALVKIIM